jgi:hypothetical protein
MEYLRIEKLQFETEFQDLIRRFSKAVLSIRTKSAVSRALAFFLVVHTDRNAR